MKTLLAVTSILSLVVCLAVPVFFFLGYLPEDGFKSALLLASLAWFILATAWASYTKKKPSAQKDAQSQERLDEIEHKN
mgnify:CR=1 FL=1